MVRKFINIHITTKEENGTIKDWTLKDVVIDSIKFKVEEKKTKKSEPKTVTISEPKTTTKSEPKKETKPKKSKK